MSLAQFWKYVLVAGEQRVNDNTLSFRQLWQFFLQIFTFLTVHFPDPSLTLVTLNKVIWISLLYTTNGKNEISIFLLSEAPSTQQSQGGDMSFSILSQKYISSNGSQKTVGCQCICWEQRFWHQTTWASTSALLLPHYVFYHSACMALSKITLSGL